MNERTNEEETFDEWFAKMEAFVKSVEEPVEKPLTPIEQLSKTVAELIRRIDDLEVDRQRKSDA